MLYSSRYISNRLNSLGRAVMLRRAKSRRSTDTPDAGLGSWWPRCAQAFRVRLIENDQFLRPRTYRRRNRIEGLHDTSHGHVACSSAGHRHQDRVIHCAPSGAIEGNERMKARGAEFTMSPTDVTASTIAMLNDSCGNLIQVTQLRR